MQYQILQKGPFEKVEKFEKRINEMSMSGWRVICAVADFHLLMGKDKY